MEKVIIHFAEIKSKEFIINEPKKYNIIKQNLSKFILSDEQEQEYKFVSNLFSQYIFFEFKYEDFILIFLRLTKFMTGLSGFIEIDEINNIFVKFFCLEENFYQLAELYKIKLQLKPYAYYYDQLSIRIDYNPNTTNEDDIRLLFHADSKNLSQQFSEMNQDDQLLFPPYETFSANKKIKFRRYTLNNDNLHNCPLDPELSSLNKPDADRKMENNELDISDNDLKQQCCSIFRGIDKLRMITNTFGDKKLLYLKKFGRLKSIILLRNYKGYEIDNQ